MAAEFSAKARSRRKAVEARKNSRKAYCRTSEASAIMGGRKVTRITPTKPVTRPRIRASHLKKIQQKAVPAITEGRGRKTPAATLQHKNKRNRSKRGDGE